MALAWAGLGPGVGWAGLSGVGLAWPSWAWLALGFMAFVCFAGLGAWRLAWPWSTFPIRGKKFIQARAGVVRVEIGPISTLTTPISTLTTPVQAPCKTRHHFRKHIRIFELLRVQRRASKTQEARVAYPRATTTHAVFHTVHPPFRPQTAPCRSSSRPVRPPPPPTERL